MRVASNSTITSGGGTVTTPSILDSEVGIGTCTGTHPEGGDCLEPLDYPTAECEICGTQAMWTRNPDAMRRRMGLAPTDELGKRVLQIISDSGGYGITHFQDKSQLERWNKITELVGEQQILDALEYCSRGKRRYGTLRHLLNHLDWLIDNGKVEAPVEIDPDVEYIP